MINANRGNFRFLAAITLLAGIALVWGVLTGNLESAGWIAGISLGSALLLAIIIWVLEGYRADAPTD
ncbi:hypothetical protein [Sphingomicrobium sediminis]|uniref:Uncharacterized protein n=1 Tax=Sphingomicrobium sediminis TaxID=2950949 RepID=A0A9X2J415_9SPHN|nr:hypothetical protein [Sphingomicrobium sediminis]MCM8557891.1 hypothetical protein [Sphingomicrobium sediminis]